MGKYRLTKNQIDCSWIVLAVNVNGTDIIVRVLAYGGAEWFVLVKGSTE